MDGAYPHEKIFNTVSHPRNGCCVLRRYCYTPIDRTKIKNNDNTKCLRGSKGT